MAHIKSPAPNDLSAIGSQQTGWFSCRRRQLGIFTR